MARTHANAVKRRWCPTCPGDSTPATGDSKVPIATKTSGQATPASYRIAPPDHTRYRPQIHISTSSKSGYSVVRSVNVTDITISYC
jgi:hypothetical protein